MIARRAVRTRFRGHWRRDYHWQMDGNLYPTHGSGPSHNFSARSRRPVQVSGFDSSSKRAITEHRDEAKPNGGRHAAEKYLCGDMNTSISSPSWAAR